MHELEQGKVEVNTDWRDWKGRVTEHQDELTLPQARLMAATLGLPQEQLLLGQPLPPLWHWLYFLEARHEAALGRDGHPLPGDFLPPVRNGYRMWAGGRVWFHRPVLLGSRLRKRSVIQAIERKSGRSGELTFVTVRHALLRADDQPLLEEEHDIVYRQASLPKGSGLASADWPKPLHREPVALSSTLLFRYSALTFNGHRIHYDQDYCRNVEGYPDLVVHGPLQATWLAGLAQRLMGRPLRRFDYRAMRPVCLGTALCLNATLDEGAWRLWTADAQGQSALQAWASDDASMAPAHGWALQPPARREDGLL